VCQQLLQNLYQRKWRFGDKKGAYRIFKIALRLFTVIGIVFCILLAISAKFIAENVLSNSGVTYSIIALSPAIIFVAIAAVYRGFFTGLNDLRPHSVSQVVEQIFNGIFSVLFVFLLLSKSPEIMAMGFSLGTTASTFISALYLFGLYKSKKRDILKEMEGETTEKDPTRAKVIVKNILRLSIPIAFASIIMSVSTIIDFATVMRGLKTFVTEVEANRQLGMLQGKIDMLLGLPLSVNVAFAMVLVPAISQAVAVKDFVNARLKVSFCLLFTILIALPASIGMSIMADPILRLVFPNASDGAYILQIVAFTTIFAAITQTMSSALQGMGDVKTPVIAIVAGSIIKLVLNLILVPIESIGIRGAAISSIVCQVVIAVIVFNGFNRKIKIELKFKKYILKPVVSTAVMAIFTIMSYKVLLPVLHSNAITTIVTLGIAMMTYGLSVAILKVFTKNEILMLPLGDKIYNILLKCRIYKNNDEPEVEKN